MKELNILKFYGILLVVSGHVVFVYSPMSIITPFVPSMTLNCLKDVIYTFHMPLFFFASGCIFSWQMEVKKKPMTFWGLLKNKAKRLMIPFYAFGLLMVYPTMVLLGFRGPIHFLIDGFIIAIDPRHLWFVLTLFLIFLLFFCLRKLCVKMQIPIWGVAIVALLLHFFPIGISYFQINNVCQYFIWFTLGYLFTLYKSKFRYLTIVALCGVAFNVVCPQTTPNLLKLFNSIVGVSIFYILSVKTIKIEDTKLCQWIGRIPLAFTCFML